MGRVIDPFPDTRLVFHGDGSHSCFGGRSRGHAELDIYIIGKSGRHFLVRAKFEVAKETVWVTRSCNRKKKKKPEVKYFEDEIRRDKKAEGHFDNDGRLQAVHLALLGVRC